MLDLFIIEWVRKMKPCSISVKIIHNWIITVVHWMVHWGLLVHCGHCEATWIILSFPFSSLIYNCTTLCSHTTIIFFAYGISNWCYLYIIFKGFLFTCAPPNTLVPYSNIGFSMPQIPFAIYFLTNHGATFLDNANYVMCHLIQYCLKLIKIPWDNLNVTLITLHNSNKPWSLDDGP